MEKITANWKKLMEDGADSAIYYFHSAIDCIDAKFGKGYAEKHPELIGAFMNTAAKETHGAVIGKCIQELAEEVDKHGTGLSNGLLNLSDEVEKLR